MSFRMLPSWMHGKVALSATGMPLFLSSPHLAFKMIWRGNFLTITWTRQRRNRDGLGQDLVSFTAAECWQMYCKISAIYCLIKTHLFLDVQLCQMVRKAFCLFSCHRQYKCIKNLIVLFCVNDCRATALMLRDLTTVTWYCLSLLVLCYALWNFSGETSTAAKLAALHLQQLTKEVVITAKTKNATFSIITKVKYYKIKPNIKRMLNAQSTIAAR